MDEVRTRTTWVTNLDMMILRFSFKTHSFQISTTRILINSWLIHYLDDHIQPRQLFSCFPPYALLVRFQKKGLGQIASFPATSCLVYIMGPLLIWRGGGTFFEGVPNTILVSLSLTGVKTPKVAFSFVWSVTQVTLVKNWSLQEFKC